jgi:hypothetical protein
MASHTVALLEHFNYCMITTLHALITLRVSIAVLLYLLEELVGSQLFSSNEELMEGVEVWLSLQAVDFFDTGIQKLVPQYDNCLNSSSDCVEK